MSESAPAAAHSSAPDIAAESRREYRKRELRSRITISAMRLFTEKGFTETTIGDICDSADVARRTLYAYFPTKQDIIRSLCRSLVIDETINGIELAIEQYPDVAARLQFMLDRMLDNMREADPLQKLLVQQLVSDQSNANESNNLMLGDLKQAFTALFSSAEGVKGLNASMSAELSAEIVISIISALSVNWMSDDNYPLVENIQQLEKYFLQHLRPSVSE